MSDSFFEEGSRLLTPHAFEFVLDAELKRAVRSQSFLTLVVLEAKREWEGLMVTADDGMVDEVAQVVGREVRDTDLIGRTEKGTLSVVLLDADFESSTRVIDRLVQRIDDYDFPTPLRISVGAACFPTHAVDAPSLTRQAASRPVVSWRGGASLSKTSNSRH
ncbi:MAG: GGDEF domain-containing protein [Vicinamibacterales bacterium]